MNGPSPDGAHHEVISDPDAMIARTAHGAPAGNATAEPGDELGATGEGAASATEPGGEPEGLEVAQLESLLDARTKELRDERTELARLRGLLRDAIARFEQSVSAGAEQVAGAARRERDLAVARALEAEAARADIGFRLDEVMGHLAAAGAAQGALPGERLDETCARLTGTVRGLVSALAEAQEGRETAQARLLLAEQDLLELRAEARAIERERAELREQLELEQLKARRLSEHWRGGLDAPAAAGLRGERDGLRARCDESERAFAALSARIGELEQIALRETESRGEAGTALAQAQAERVVLLEELARARAESAAAAAPDARLERYAEALRGTRAELSELGAALGVTRPRPSGPVSGLETSPGGDAPLQTDSRQVEQELAASADRVRQLEARLSSAAATIAGLEASAPTAGAAQQLAALRSLLERR